MSHRIVIIGGMGPQASLELHERIIARAAQAGARDNEDYPEILHASIPIPDFISSGDSTAGMNRLKQSLDKLQIRKDDAVVLACNTVHLLLPEIEATYNFKFVSLVEATVEKITKTSAKRIGLLASPTTIKSRLYEKPLANAGCKVILPTNSDIDVLEQAIRHVIAGKPAEQVRGLVEPIVSRMIDEGADYVVLGCTELSIILGAPNDSRIVDPLRVVCEMLLS